jgi:uncharacterized protein YndB with AHSA1/START domain
MMPPEVTSTTALWGDGASIVIAATPEAVWTLLCDIPRMGQWSPVCRRCEYLDGASSPSPGTRFVGHNRQAGARWSRTCVITQCDPGRTLAFHTLFRGEVGTRWRYELKPHAGGTHLTEAYELLSMPRWVRAMQQVPTMTARSRRVTHRGMERTLSKIKAAAESGHDQA